MDKLLRGQDYSLQESNESVESAQHPDRDSKFEHINAQPNNIIYLGVRVISVYVEKTGLVGNFKCGGREWQPHGEPELVDVHDFLSATTSSMPSPTASKTSRNTID